MPSRYFLLKKRSAATRIEESRPIILRRFGARAPNLRARPSAPRATHGAVQTATHQHGDWLHRSRNLEVTAGFCNHPVNRQSELLVDPLIGRRFAEPLDAHDHAVLADPAVPGLWR